MSGPIKHSTTGLWVGGGDTTRGQRRRVMNIHVVGGLNGCCLKELWPVANSLDIKRQLFFPFFFLSPLTISKCQCQRHTMGKAPCAHKWHPKSQHQLFFSFYSVSRFGLQSLPAKWCSAEWRINRAIAALAGRTLQHFRHLFHLTACLTSAGCILLTQDSVSWTGIGACRDTMEVFLLSPVSSPSCERTAERE